jgi:hypothetical protein
MQHKSVCVWGGGGRGLKLTANSHLEGSGDPVCSGFPQGKFGTFDSRRVLLRPSYSGF